VTGVAEHLTKFWDLRMRDAIVNYWEASGAGLDPCVHEAVGRLRAARGEAVPKSA
jgi:formate dehydrogenase subunit delta